MPFLRHTRGLRYLRCQPCCTSHPSGSRMLNPHGPDSDPLSPFGEPENRQCHVMSNSRFLRSRGYEPTHCRLITWAAKSSETGMCGCSGCQSGLVVFPTPVVVHRCIRSSAKQLLRHIGNVVTHDVICCPRQLMRKRLVSHHAIGPLCLALIVCTGLIVEPPAQF